MTYMESTSHFVFRYQLLRETGYFKSIFTIFGHLLCNVFCVRTVPQVINRRFSTAAVSIQP